jgi:hypothetical protein
MQKMGLAQSRVSVKKERVVRVARRLTYRHAARVSKAVARTNHKTLKSIIWIELNLGTGELRAGGRNLLVICDEFNADQMAGYLLGCPRKTAPAIVTQKPNGCLVGTADSQAAPIEVQHRQLLEPLAGIGWIQRFCSPKYIGENIFNWLSCQNTLLLNSLLRQWGLSTKHPYKRLPNAQK